jgi:hypothetical protein
MLRERQRKGTRFARHSYVGPEGPTHKTTADPEDLIEDLRQALA